MTDYEVLQVIMKIAELRSSTEYRKAYLLVRPLTATQRGSADKNSAEYAAIRLLIGTWESIAIFTKEFNATQRYGFFRCHPVLLMWQFLEPSIAEGRKSFDAKFAMEFENLRKEYEAWIKTEDGKGFSTAQQQAICARFA